MSFGGAGPKSFLRPLIGKSTTFVLEGRDANLMFARMVAEAVASDGTDFAVLDLDAVYSSNADRVMANGHEAESVIRTPSAGAPMEEELAWLFQSRQRVLIIDSLNSLYHLLSAEGGNSRSRRLNFAVASLSYFARTNGRAVLFSIYRRARAGRPSPSHPISEISDMTASVSLVDGTLTVKGHGGLTWGDAGFSTRIPSG